MSSAIAGSPALTRSARWRGCARYAAISLIPSIALHHGRVVKRTGDGSIIEFRSVVDAVRCAIEVQTGMVERNAGVAPDERIEFRVGIHLGDVVEEADGDLMGDGVNIAARLEGVCEPGGVCLSEDAYRQVRDKLKEVVRRSRREGAKKHRAAGASLRAWRSRGLRPAWKRDPLVSKDAG